MKQIGANKELPGIFEPCYTKAVTRQFGKKILIDTIYAVEVN